MERFASHSFLNPSAVDISNERNENPINNPKFPPMELMKSYTSFNPISSDKRMFVDGKDIQTDFVFMFSLVEILHLCL